MSNLGPLGGGGGGGEEAQPLGMQCLDLSTFDASVSWIGRTMTQGANT